MRTLLYIIALLSTACRYTDFSSIEPVPAKPWAATALLADLVPTTVPISGNVVVEGVVVANDSTGNFYKQVILVDRAQSAAIAVGIAYYDSYSQFPENEVVALSLDGLVLCKVDGLLTAGYPPTIPDTIPAPISTFALVARHLHTQGERAALPTIECRFDELTAEMIGRPFLFLDSYFENPYGTYAGEHTLGRIAGAEPDTAATLYTSPYATFAADPLPRTAFDLRAIVMSHKNKIQLKTASKP